MRLEDALSRFADLLRNARALVFDFDGTLVDSNPIKRRAFVVCFAEFPERLTEILDYCWNRHHTPRGEKFRHIYEEVLGIPYTAEVSAKLHTRFEAETTRQIIAAVEIPGASAFLRAAHGRYVRAVLSSTPHEILLAIVDGRGWRGLFEILKGAPVEKGKWLQEFCDNQKLRPSQIVCFGDTMDDAQAAALVGCRFILIGAGVAADRAVPQLGNFQPFLRDGRRLAFAA